MHRAVRDSHRIRSDGNLSSIWMNHYQGILVLVVVVWVMNILLMLMIIARNPRNMAHGSQVIRIEGCCDAISPQRGCVLGGAFVEARNRPSHSIISQPIDLFVST